MILLHRKTEWAFRGAALSPERHPGSHVKEFDRSRERSLCCEGGGGRMWVEASDEKAQRLARTRVADAVAMGAQVLVTACPFCLLTLEDMVKTSGHEKTLQVMDVMEVLAEALLPTARVGFDRLFKRFTFNYCVFNYCVDNVLLTVYGHIMPRELIVGTDPHTTTTEHLKAALPVIRHLKDR